MAVDPIRSAASVTKPAVRKPRRRVLVNEQNRRLLTADGVPLIFA